MGSHRKKVYSGMLYNFHCGLQVSHWQNLVLQLVYYFSTQGRSHQNLSGQVEIILQGSTSSDFQIIVIVVHSSACIAYYRRVGTGPADPGTA